MTPVKLMFSCCLIRFLMWIIEVIVLDIRHSISDRTVLYFTGIVFILFSGYFFGNLIYDTFYGRRRNVITKPAAEVLTWNPNFSINFVIGAALFYSILLGVDIFLIRSLDYSEGLASARQTMLVGTESVYISMFRIITYIFSGFGVLAGVVAVFLNEQLPNKTQIALWLVFALSIAVNLLTGARNYLMFSLICIWVAYRINPLKKRMTRKSKLFIFFGSIGSLALILIVFVYRFMYHSGSDPYYILQYVSTTITGYEAIANIDTSDFSEEFAWFLIAVQMLYFYISHALYIFDDLLNSSFIPGPYWGGYNFNIYFRALSKFGLGVSVSAEEISLGIAEAELKTGAYSTLFGVSVMDFGILGSFVFIFILFTYFQLCYRIVKQLNYDRELCVMHFIYIYMYLIFSVSFLYSLFNISIGGLFPITFLLIGACKIFCVKSKSW